MDDDARKQITDAYKKMAIELRYRPAAPGDGFGNITVRYEELDVEKEAVAYARAWWKEEDKGDYIIGSPNYELRPAMVHAIEAAKQMCAGDNELARKLLLMAADEVDVPTIEESVPEAA